MRVRRFSVPLLVLTLGCSSSSLEPPPSADAGDFDVDSAEVFASSRITGRLVLDGVDDRSGIEVLLVGRSTTKTVKDGTFVFDDVPVGTATILVQAPSTEERTWLSSIPVTADAPADLGDVALTPLGNVAGRVVFASGEPAPSVAVSAVGTPAVALTGPDGRFVLSRVRSGARKLLAALGSTDSATADVTVPYAQTLDASDLVLAPVPKGKGTIVGTAKLVGETDHHGMVVSLIGPSTASVITDPTGSFRFEKLADGAYTLHLAAPSTLEGSRTVPLSVAGAEVGTGEISFSPYGRIEGKVTLASATTGNGGVVVTADGAAAPATTADDGSFSLDRVPTGAHAIVAMKSGYATATATTPAVPYGKAVTVPTLNLAFDPVTTATVTGKALLPGVTDHSGTTVEALGTSRSGKTDSTGAFSILGAPSSVATTLKASNGGYQEEVPGVFLMGKGTPYVVEDGALVPLAPIDLVRGRRVTSATARIWPTPDGRRLIVERAAGTDIVNVSTGAVSSWPSKLSVDEPPVLAPNGLYAIVWDTSSYYPGASFVDLASGTWTSLGSASQPVFSADGSRLAFVSLGPLTIWDTATAKIVRTVSEGGCPRLSPDGKRISRDIGMYSFAPKVVLTRLSDGVETTVDVVGCTSSWPPGRAAHGFTGDGRFFVWVSPDGATHVRDLMSPGEPVTDVPGAAKRLDLASVGSWFVTSGDTSARVHNGLTSALVSDVSYPSVSFSETDGRPLILNMTEGKPRVRLFATPTSLAFDLVGLVHFSKATRFSADGTKAVMASVTGRGLYAIDIAAGGVARLIDPDYRSDTPTFIGAGSNPMVIYQNVADTTGYQHVIAAAPFDGSSPAKPLSASEYGPVYLTLSPDGSRAVYGIGGQAASVELTSTLPKTPLMRVGAPLVWGSAGIVAVRSAPPATGAKYTLGAYLLNAP